MKKSRKTFIKEGHSAACSEWKLKIEEEFPKLFKNNGLEVNKWYTRTDDGRLWFVTKIKNGCHYGYGFDYNGNWADLSKDYNYGGFILNIASDKEIKDRLMLEARDRGFEIGAKFDVNSEFYGTSFGGDTGVNIVSKLEFNYVSHSNTLNVRCTNVGKMCVFRQGVWATVIEDTITKEEAEKQLGKTILN